MRSANGWIRTNSHTAGGAVVSRKGVIGPVRVSRKSAAVVGTLLKFQLASDNLEDTPLALLPSFAQKLRDGAVRKRASENLWTLTRAEALAGFHYLALYRRQDVPANTLTPLAMHAVREVVLALMDALVARRGPERLGRAAVERRLSPSDDDRDLFLDLRWLDRLKLRVEREKALGSTPLSPIPKRLYALLTGQKYR
jgi:hypothetical protein